MPLVCRDQGSSGQRFQEKMLDGEKENAIISDASRHKPFFGG